MKTLHLFSTLVLTFLFSSALFSQSTSISENIGFGGPSFVNTSIAGEWTMEVGGLGGGFIGRHLYIGGAGFGSSQKKDGFEYDMGYGGPMLGYLWQGDKKTALNFYLLGGYGGLTQKDKDNREERDNLWVVKPAVEIEFTITDWWRIGVGGGYRWVSGFQLSSLDDNDLSAPFGSITFRLGKWKN